MGTILASLIALIFIIPAAIKATKRRRLLAGSHLHTLAHHYKGKLNYHSGPTPSNRVEFIARGVPFTVTMKDQGALEVHADVSSKVRADLAVSLRWAVAPNLQFGRQKTHDHEFDSRVFIGGDPQVVAGLMSQQVRAVTRANAARSATIVNGRLKVRLPAEVDIVSSIEALVTWTDQLSTNGRDLGEDMVENALNDPIPNVRQRNLQLLSPWVDANPDMSVRLAPCLEDPSEGVRTAAGATLRHGPTLLAIAENSKCRLETRIQAVRGLSRVSYEVSVAALTRLVTTSQSAKLVGESLEVLARHGALPAVDVLENLVEKHPRQVSWQIARLLENVSGPQVEGLLCELLQNDWLETRIRAAESLGSVGTYSAVVPLRALTSFGNAPAAKLVAEAAIERIQERLGPVDAGRLSMVDGHAGGELSVALGEGALSQAEPESRSAAEPETKEPETNEPEVTENEVEASEVDT